MIEIQVLLSKAKIRSRLVHLSCRISDPIGTMKERSTGFLSIPFDSKLSETDHTLPIPPLQSLMEVEKEEIVSESNQQNPSLKEEHDLEVLFSAHAAEAAHALNKHKADGLSSSGINPDGSRWWKEIGIEERPDGMVCRWTINCGVSADQDVEWQEKLWEATDEFGYKELGSEKSGRDAIGNLWREFWRESLLQVGGKFSCTLLLFVILLPIMEWKFSFVNPLVNFVQ